MQSVLSSGSVESKKAEYPSNTSLMSEQRMWTTSFIA